MLYTNQENIEKVLKRSLTAEEIEVIPNLIEATSSVVSGYLNRTYNDISGTNPAASARLYDGNRQKELFVDDFQSISKVELLDSEGDVFEAIDTPTRWLTYPLNTTPKNSIVLREYIFPMGNARVRVTGVFTSGALPSAITNAVSLLVADSLTQLDTNGALAKESIEGYSYELKSDSQFTEKQTALLQTIDRYRKIEL
jgi:hypothetical protein